MIYGLMILPTIAILLVSVIFVGHEENINLNDLFYDRLANRYHCNIQNWNEIVHNYKNVTILENSNFLCDYGVESHKDSIILRSKNRRTSEWLIEQYIKYLSYTDTCINTSDLPPTVVDFEKSEDRDFDFIYREPHFSPNLKKKYEPYTGSNSVEEYWELWGHNLYKEIKIYKGKQQVICFSNEAFFNNVVKYLESKSSTLHTGRFIIMPMDTVAACICPKCKEFGNSANYATPALMNMLDRLADKFSTMEQDPKYSFYTVAYHSTLRPPKQPPKYRTAGLLVTTSDLPKGIALDPKKVNEGKFIKTIQAWKDATDELYVWDYAANFNDFLTPLPILNVLKKNLKFFHDCGISGIFLQGSSYDYSTFDDVKTFAAMALMIDNRLDVDDLCIRFFKQYYPVSAELLSDYYLSLEKAMEQREQEYEIHGNMDSAIKSYFSVSDFLAFYHRLGSILTEKKMSDDERYQLEKLYSALSFTRLQIALYQQTRSYDIPKINGKTFKLTPEIENAIKWLSKYDQYDFKNYKEKNGDLKNYLESWKKVMKKDNFVRRLDLNHLKKNHI